MPSMTRVEHASRKDIIKYVRAHFKIENGIKKKYPKLFTKAMDLMIARNTLISVGQHKTWERERFKIVS